jgi:hypothetical protein
MQYLQNELVFTLERDEAHGGRRRGLGDCLGITIVGLLSLHVGLHVLRRHKPDLVTLLA